MSTRYFALILGIVFLLIGVLGFVPAFVTPAEEHDLTVEWAHGRLFDLFPVNGLHNLVHILFGVWGIAAYASFGASRFYARAVAVAYALLAIMGFIPYLRTIFGLIPIHGNDIWLHALLAIAGAYFGWVAAPAEARHLEGRTHAA